MSRVKNSITSAALGLGILASCGVMVQAEDGQEAKWFDLENCAICKHMGQHPELITATQCETHAIDNGMLTVSSIPPEHKQAMEAAHKKMEATIGELMAGKKLNLCAFCTGYGNLMAAGAKPQEIETSIGTISLLTSDQPEVIKQIQEFARQSQKASEEMIKRLKSAANK